MRPSDSARRRSLFSCSFPVHDTQTSFDYCATLLSKKHSNHLHRAAIVPMGCALILDSLHSRFLFLSFNFELEAFFWIWWRMRKEGFFKSQITTRSKKFLRTYPCTHKSQIP
jgi:hypothetical protein